MSNEAITKFCRDETGATALEYGLIAGLISVSVIGGLSVYGGNLGTYYDWIVQSFMDTY